MKVETMHTINVSTLCVKKKDAINIGSWKASKFLHRNRQNRLRFVYTHFKSCDQSPDETSFDFSYTFRAMQSYAMNAKNSIIPNFPKRMIT